MTIFGSHECWPSYSYYWIFNCIWWYLEVYGGIWRCMEVYDGIWRYSAQGAPVAGAPAAGELMLSELYHQGGMRIGRLYT